MTNTFPAGAGFTWRADDGSALMARTSDNPSDPDRDSITAFNIGHPLSTSPNSAPDTKTTIPFIAGSCPCQSSNTPVYLDGVNMEGLMCSAHGFPGYGRRSPVKGRGIHPEMFVPVALGTCSSLGEVVELAKMISATPDSFNWGGVSSHWLFSDRSGEAVVIEPDDDGVKIYRSTIGVLANAPDYEWQISKLIHWSPDPSNPYSDWTGGGATLPGGYASQDRFARLAWAKGRALAPATAEEAVPLMFSMLTIAYVPEWVTAEKGKYATRASVLRSDNPTYYFTSSRNRRISSYNLASAITHIPRGATSISFPLPLLSDISRVV